MSLNESSSNKYHASRIQDVLCAANIFVVGTYATALSVIRDLYKAGAKKISLLNVDAWSTKIENVDATENSFCQKIDLDWTIANIENAISGADLVIDTLSDWQKKLALSDVCMENDKVLVHSGITGFRFQIYTMIPGRSACLRCALPLAGIDEVPRKPAVESTIDAVIELVDAWLSLESIKYLAKIGIVQGNELFKFDCLSGEFEVIRGLDGEPDCPDCGRKVNRRLYPIL